MKYGHSMHIKLKPTCASSSRPWLVTHIHGYPSRILKAQQLARTVLIDNWFTHWRNYLLYMAIVCRCTPSEPPDPDEQTKTHCKSNWNPHLQVQATHSYPSRKLNSTKTRKDSIKKTIERHETAYEEMWSLFADAHLINHRIRMSRLKPTANQTETHLCKPKQP